MQGQPAQRIGLGAIFFIAGNGVAKVGHVDANLVFASGDQGDIEQGISGTFFDYLVVGLGLLPLFTIVPDCIDPQGL